MVVPGMRRHFLVQLMRDTRKYYNGLNRMVVRAIEYVSLDTSKAGRLGILKWAIVSDEGRDS